MSVRLIDCRCILFISCILLIPCHFLFAALVAHPTGLTLRTPIDFGLYGTRHFYVKHGDTTIGKEIRIGVWHMLPNYIVHKFAKQFNLSEVCFNVYNQAAFSLLVHIIHC